MIPEYLFKQAEREANAAMMKELYAEGGMDPAVAGVDPEEIDPEVAAAINTILSKLQKPEEPEERHTVEKASSLRDCILKMADFDPNKDYGHLKADDMQIPETTWFESLANSAPVSALLDTADSAYDFTKERIDNLSDSISNFSSRIGNAVEDLSDLAGMTYTGTRDSLIEGIPNIKDYMPSISEIDDILRNPESKYRITPSIILNEMNYRFGKPFMHKSIERDIKNPVEQDLAKAKFYTDYLANEAKLKGIYQTLNAGNAIKNNPVSKRIGDYINYYTN